MSRQREKKGAAGRLWLPENAFQGGQVNFSRVSTAFTATGLLFKRGDDSTQYPISRARRRTSASDTPADLFSFHSLGFQGFSDKIFF